MKFSFDIERSITLVMTATVDPKGMASVTRADPAVREVFLGTEVTAALAGGSLEASAADGGPVTASPVDGDGAVGGDRSEP